MVLESHYDVYFRITLPFKRSFQESYRPIVVFQITLPFKRSFQESYRSNGHFRNFTVRCSPLCGKPICFFQIKNVNVNFAVISNRVKNITDPRGNLFQKVNRSTNSVYVQYCYVC